MNGEYRDACWQFIALVMLLYLLLVISAWYERGFR